MANIFDKFLSLFKRKNVLLLEDLDLKDKLEVIELGMDMLAESCASTTEKTKDLPQYQTLVSNAITNIDSRVEQLEKLVNILYDRLVEIEEKVFEKDETNTQEEFMRYAQTLKTENNDDS